MSSVGIIARIVGTHRELRAAAQCLEARPLECIGPLKAQFLQFMQASRSFQPTVCQCLALPSQANVRLCTEQAACWCACAKGEASTSTTNPSCLEQEALICHISNALQTCMHAQRRANHLRERKATNAECMQRHTDACNGSRMIGLKCSKALHAAMHAGVCHMAYGGENLQVQTELTEVVSGQPLGQANPISNSKSISIFTTSYTCIRIC